MKKNLFRKKGILFLFVLGGVILGICLVLVFAGRKETKQDNTAIVQNRESIVDDNNILDEEMGDTKPDASSIEAYESEAMVGEHVDIDLGDADSTTAEVDSELGEASPVVLGENPDLGEAGPEISDGKSDNANGRILLVMVGDILLHDRVEESAKREDGAYDFSSIFSDIREEIAGADLALVNQEVIIGGEALGVSGYPAFNAPFSIGDELADTGFDVILHGTNHALDKGERGIMNCLNFWEENYPDIAVLGVHDSWEDQSSIEYVEINGITLAILNYTYGTNGISTPEGKGYLVDYLSEERVIGDLHECEESADFTIVCPHWGTEYELGVTSSQKKWADIFYENGADLVIGTHPHVIEPIGWIGKNNQNQENEDPCKDENAEGDEKVDSDDKAEGDYKNPNGMLVYYSLGNCVNWTSGEGAGVSNRMVGAMARITIEKNEEGKPVILEYGVEPLISHVTSQKGGVSVKYLRDYSEELAEENEIKSQAADFSYAYCVELCRQVFGDLWLPSASK